MVINSDFWRNKKILVTGHTGFKGTWLSLLLHSMGAKVFGFALPPQTNPNLFELTHLSEDMDSYFGDIRDFNSLSSFIKSNNPEIVFHLAAQSLVHYSYHNPIETYATNVMGTVHILEALRQINSARVMVNVTSDKCYDNREWVWGYRENDPMGGWDPYSSSKGCAELVTEAYRRSYFSNSDTQLVLATARAGNVIGGGDWAANRLIPDFMRSVFSGETLLIRNPTSIRPWQHVLESLSGYLLLAERLWLEGEKFTGGWNFGPLDEDSKPVKWIIEYLIKLWGDPVLWDIDQKDHPHEMHTLKLDISKARLKLKWHPQWSLAKSLQAVVEWYKAYYQNLNIRELMLKQIIEYKKG